MDEGGTQGGDGKRSPCALQAFSSKTSFTKEQMQKKKSQQTTSARGKLKGHSRDPASGKMRGLGWNLGLAACYSVAALILQAGPAATQPQKNPMRCSWVGGQAVVLQDTSELYPRIYSGRCFVPFPTAATRVTAH